MRRRNFVNYDADLKEYCKQDTLGMVELLKILKSKKIPVEK